MKLYGKINVLSDNHLIFYYHYRDDLSRALPKLREEVRRWCAAADKHSAAEGNQERMKEVKSLVKDALSDPDHPLFSLHERSEKYHPEISTMFNQLDESSFCVIFPICHFKKKCTFN